MSTIVDDAFAAVPHALWHQPCLTPFEPSRDRSEAVRRLHAAGLTQREIARELHISLSTVVGALYG